MKKSVQFTQVSKQYRLGLTRTSLPTIVSKTIRRLFPNGNSDLVSERRFIWALRDISFDLSSGQSLALIGPNGAGKTTILKLLAKITRPTMGDIAINGRLSALIELGAGFHPDLTGRENVYLNGIILGLSRREIDKRFEEIVAFSELDQFIDTPVKRYSSGMSVRLGFSVAACIEPDILLVDEVLAVGDATFRKKCTDRIKDMLKKGTSIIFVSHNLWLVQAVCDSAIYIEKGQVKHRGVTAEVIDVYNRDIHERRAADLELTRADEAEMLNVIEITKIEVVGHEAEQGGGLANNLPAEVRVHYAAYNLIGATNMVVRIVRSDGVTCCMMRSMLDDFPISVERGIGVISVVLDPLQLYGGSYFAQAVVRDGSDSWGMTSKWSDPFYVYGSPLSHQEMNGVFEPRRTWKHSRSISDSHGDPRNYPQSTDHQF